MQELSPGRKLHQQALESQERGELDKSLELSEQAVKAYEKDRDDLGAAEIQALRFLTFRHKYDQTNDRSFLEKAVESAQKGVGIAKDSGQTQALAIPLFNLAKAYETLGENQKAVSTFKEALALITNNPPEIHNRPAVVADFKCHLATAELRTGEGSLPKAEESIKELETAAGASDYERAVWVSGAHMRIAEILKNTDLQTAREHLAKAKEIIDQNPELTIRLDQWKKIAELFKE